MCMSAYIVRTCDLMEGEMARECMRRDSPDLGTA